jgi:xylulokinase
VSGNAYWLGIDVGTGSTRALLIDEGGTVRAAQSAPHEPMYMERPMWAEQRPENWWYAAQLAIRSVLSNADISGVDVRGISLSGQMHGLVLLDQNGEVVRPALIWCDQRSQAQVDAINKSVGNENVVAYTANPVLTGFTLPKLLWVRDHEPALFARVRHVLLPKDYLRYKLTDASGTALFNVVERRWSFEMADRLGIDKNVLPRVHESVELSGKISRVAAAATGLIEGTPVFGGAGDQAASAIGNGIVEPGIVSCTIGTSGVVFAHMQSPRYDLKGRVHSFCHAVPGAWHVMGVTQGAGLSLQWFRNQLAPGTDYDTLTAEAASAEPGSQGLFWLPYLMGERTPHLDASARGGWIGLTAKHTRADLIRSIVEGVSYSLKDCLDIVESLGVTVTSVRASGGGAKSGFWRQLLADIFGKRVTVLETEEGSAYGAALLALAGTSKDSSITAICKRSVREVASFDPRPEQLARYTRGHLIYQSLYPSLRGFYSAETL